MKTTVIGNTIEFSLSGYKTPGEQPYISYNLKLPNGQEIDPRAYFQEKYQPHPFFQEGKDPMADIEKKYPEFHKHALEWKGMGKRERRIRCTLQKYLRNQIPISRCGIRIHGDKMELNRAFYVYNKYLDYQNYLEKKRLM